MTLMMSLLILLGCLLAVLTVLVIYRNTLEMHEDDQLFIDSSESHMAAEQAELQTKLSKLEPMVRWVGAACGLVTVTVIGMWLYAALNRSPIQ